MVQLALISAFVMQGVSIVAAGAAEQQALLQFGVRQSSAIYNDLVIEGKPEETRHRRTKLQAMLTSGEDMEKQYREMALAAMDGCPKPPCDKATMPERDMLVKLFEQFDNLITELVNVSQPCNQDMIDHANGEVHRCSQDMNASCKEEAIGVDALKAVTQDARVDHEACRKRENTEWKSRESACQAFDETVKECHSYEWFASQETGPDSHLHVVSLSVDCTEKTGMAEDISPKCEQRQMQFESDFCQYSMKLRSVCSTYSSCYAETLAARKTTLKEIEEEVEAQKNIYFSVEKARCFVNILDGLGRSGNVTKSDVESCMSLEVDTSILDVDYIPPADESPCDTSPVTNVPGDAQWGIDEYAGLPDDHACTTSTVCKLADPLVCIGVSDSL